MPTRPHLPPILSVHPPPPSTKLSLCPLGCSRLPTRLVSSERQSFPALLRVHFLQLISEGVSSWKRRKVSALPLSFLWRRGWWCRPGCFQKPEGGRAGLARPFEPHVWSWSGPAGFIQPCSQARTTYSALGVLAGPPDSSLTPSPSKWRGHRESQHCLGSCLRDTLTPERETTDQWFVSSSDATESFHLDSHPMLPTSQQGLIYHDVASFTAMRFSCRGS